MMNPQIERFFHSIRRGLMELPRQKDLDALRKRIEGLKDKELRPLARKLDEMKRELSKLTRKPRKKKPAKRKA